MISFKILTVIVVSTLGTISSDKTKDYEDHPYEFSFTIDGEQHRKESKDINGIVKGEFGFITADGVYHVTVYATDEHGLFHIISMKNIRLGDLPKSEKKSNIVSTTTLPPPRPARYDNPTTQPPPPPMPVTQATRVKDFTNPPALRLACSSCTIPLKSPIASPPQPDLQVLQPPRKADVEVRTQGITQTDANPIKISLARENDIDTRRFNEDNKIVHDKIQARVDVLSQADVSAGGIVPLNKQEQIVSIAKTGDTQGKPQSDGGKRTIGEITSSNPEFESVKFEGKYPNMNDGLPDGIKEGDISDLLYKFNYTVGFHGHYEKGLKDGSKVGGYFVNGRDGISVVVTYVADKNGYHPKVRFINLGLDSPDTPKEDTEKTFGLKNFEFVWYPAK